MIRSTLGGWEGSFAACGLATWASKPAAPLLSKSLRVNPFIRRRATELEPAELGNGFAKRFVLLNEGKHAVLRLVELLGFLQHFGRVLTRYNNHTIHIGDDDVRRANQHARATHRNILTSYPKMIHRGGRDHAAAEYRKLQFRNLRRIADPAVDDSPRKASVFHGSAHEAADSCVV